jgi:hypothetical protein
MHAFAEPLAVELVRVPVPSGGALIEVRATGLCPSDWPGWKGDDPAIYFPRGPDTCWPAWLRLSVINCAGYGRATSPAPRAVPSGPHAAVRRRRRAELQRVGLVRRTAGRRVVDLNGVRVTDGVRFDEAAALGCRAHDRLRGGPCVVAESVVGKSQSVRRLDPAVQAGSAPRTPIGRLSEPSDRMIISSPRRENAMKRPSGDQAGPTSSVPASVSRRASIPSAVMIQMAR